MEAQKVTMKKYQKSAVIDAISEHLKNVLSVDEYKKWEKQLPEAKDVLAPQIKAALKYKPETNSAPRARSGYMLFCSARSVELAQQGAKTVLADLAKEWQVHKENNDSIYQKYSHLSQTEKDEIKAESTSSKSSVDTKSIPTTVYRYFCTINKEEAKTEAEANGLKTMDVLNQKWSEIKSDKKAHEALKVEFSQFIAKLTNAANTNSKGSTSADNGINNVDTEPDEEPELEPEEEPEEPEEPELEPEEDLEVDLSVVPSSFKPKKKKESREKEWNKLSDEEKRTFLYEEV